MTGPENRRRIRNECAETRPTVTALPYYYAIHLNEPCNQRCIMCVPHGDHGRGVLPFERFVRLFDGIKSVAEHVTLIGGETFMYPRILDVLQLLARHPVAVTINTNATMLTARVVPALMALHELHLKCSIDGATRETYRRIRGTDVFDRVTANIRRFSEASGGRPHLRLILVYVVMRENLHEVVPFVDFARTLQLDRVEFHPVRHVREWRVDNGTGWTLDGRAQSCETFREEYNDVMRRAEAACAAAGIGCEINLL
jgi:MoaA/NifB/PqqE/SkfB family radical SAM enzyme